MNQEKASLDQVERSVAMIEDNLMTLNVSGDLKPRLSGEQKIFRNNKYPAHIESLTSCA